MMEMVDMGCVRSTLAARRSCRFESYFSYKCPCGGMVDTAVLEAVAERRESSNLSMGTAVD